MQKFRMKIDIVFFLLYVPFLECSKREDIVQSRCSMEKLFIQPAQRDQVDSILKFWDAHGEENVDSRDRPFLEGAIEFNGLHIAVDRLGYTRATFAIYPYSGGKFAEFASSCWDSSIRGMGGAPVALAFRVARTVLTENDPIIGAELYRTSVASRKVLTRSGFVEVAELPAAMHVHAQTADASKSVTHFVLPPWEIPAQLNLFTYILEHGGLPTSQLQFGFSERYHFWNRAVISGLRALGQQQTLNPDSIAEQLRSLPMWLAERSGDQLLTYDQFQDIGQKNRV
jgi:hypothetical protein